MLLECAGEVVLLPGTNEAYMLVCVSIYPGFAKWAGGY